MKRFLTLWMLLLLLGAPALAQSVPADVPQEEAEAVPHEERLTVGDSGDAVAQLQTKLSELYYYTGDITGSYGEVTAAAVSAFQWDFGLEGTGIADQATLDAIREASRRPLRLGCVGEDVRQLQVRLMALGFYEGSVSGTYLPSTESAVYTFQLACGEIATGEADLDTLTLLYQEDAITYAQSADALPSPTPTAPPMVIVAEVEITPMPTVAYEKKLKYESKGELVKTLQQRLTDLGYYSGNISGNFLGNTRNAVKAFQQQNALEVDGVVGEMTWNALFNDPDVRAADDAPKPTPEPTPVPYAITVDVQNQVTTVYGLDENGQYTKVVRQMLCSTGTKSAPSDVGDWVLTGRTARWCDFPKWGGHAQFWTKINDSIAFHSVIYSDYDTMKLNTSSYKKLGQRASHGCIRLTVADARWIYENCGAGVVVTITEDLPADPELRYALKLPALDYSVMLPIITPAPTAAPEYVSGAQPPQPFKTLKKNSEGEAVYWLQCKLKELGYYNGYIGGKYLDGTANAVKAFQKDHGLSANGTANEQTLRKIYEQELATPSPTPTATPTAVPTPTTSPVPTERPTPTPTPTRKPQ